MLNIDLYTCYIAASMNVRPPGRELHNKWAFCYILNRKSYFRGNYPLFLHFQYTKFKNKVKGFCQTSLEILRIAI